MSELDNDPVNSPSHYTQGGVECIDAMQASMTAEQFVGYCKGNAMKYIWRFDSKGKAKEDLEKAAWYLDRLRRAVDIRDAVAAVEYEEAERAVFDLEFDGVKWRMLGVGETIERGDAFGNSIRLTPYSDASIRRGEAVGSWDEMYPSYRRIDGRKR